MSQNPTLITYDKNADAAYVYLTGKELARGRDTVQVPLPEGVSGMILIDFKDGKIVGVEILDAQATLHDDLLAQAVRIDEMEN